MRKRIILSVMMLLGLLAPTPTTVALDLQDARNNAAEGSCEVRAKTPEAKAACKSDSSSGSFVGIIKTIINILLFLVGSIAVIMIVIGGLRYLTSNGDQNAVTTAKNTILYAIIGIVVAFLAYAAVNFVITQLQAGSTSS